MNNKLISKYKEFLESLENNFYTVTYSNYCRTITKDKLVKLKEFYDEYMNTNRSVNYSCNRCVYNLVKDVATIWYEYKNSKKSKTSKDHPAT